MLRRTVETFDRTGGIFLMQLASGTFFGQFSVKFAADQQKKRGPIEPDHECDESAQGAVRFTEVCEMPEINAEQVRESNPGCHGEERARQSRQKSLLHIGSKKVDDLNRNYRKADRDDSMDDGP